MSEPLPIRVLVVDDEPVSRTVLERYLTGAGHEVFTAASGKEAVRILRADGPEVVITDWMMPHMDGLELCRAIRSSEVLPFVYVIIVTAQGTGEEQVVEAFEAGADDYLSKPINRRELLARLNAGARIVHLQLELARRSREVHRTNAQIAIASEKLEQANRKLGKAATTDHLTGLTNRRAALAHLDEYWRSADRHVGSLACVALDIDHFKSINDTHGHAVGDLVLQETVAALGSVLRRDETLCRMGGEEFLVLCPQADESEAAVAAERLRRVVEANVIRSSGLELQVTVSLGVAEKTSPMAAPNDMLRAADEALYAAKAAGRNQVCVGAPAR